MNYNRLMITDKFTAYLDLDRGTTRCNVLINIINFLIQHLTSVKNNLPKWTNTIRVFSCFIRYIPTKLQSSCLKSSTFLKTKSHGKYSESLFSFNK